MASKKSLRQLATMKALYLDEKTMSYRPSKGFIILDGDEDGYVVNYISFVKDDGAWSCEYTNGFESTRIPDSRAEFRLYKQV
jgi:hypothetical protein